MEVLMQELRKHEKKLARLNEELQKKMEKENIDLEHQPIQIIEVGTKTLEEKSCLLKEQHDRIDVDILDEQIDANI